jgi:hypothetical protein
MKKMVPLGFAMLLGCARSGGGAGTDDLLRLAATEASPAIVRCVVLTSRDSDARSYAFEVGTDGTVEFKLNGLSDDKFELRAYPIPCSDATSSGLVSASGVLTNVGMND